MSAELERFVEAQTPVWREVIGELEAGAKQSHWMWFVFPQLHGLGSSPMAVRYAIASLTEAQAYGAHRVLGPRLHEATGLMLRHAGTPAEAILGGVDALKFRSSMTLFRHAVPDEPQFGRALEAFYGGEEDPKTVELLGDR